MIDERHPGPLRFFRNDFACLSFGADEENGAAIARQLPHVLHGILVHLHRLFQIDDVNLIALAEDVIGHLRIPVTGLVTEVDPGFQHLTHRDRHYDNSFRVGPPPADVIPLI